VTGRISKFTYGTLGTIAYDPSDSEHVQRSYNSLIDAMGEKRIPDNFSAMLTRVRHSVFTRRFRLNSIALQGTKILENREIQHRRSAVTEDAPRKHALTRIIKYTGALASPEWEDVEPGRVFGFPCYFVKSAQSQKTSSKHCVVSRPTSPVLHIHRNSWKQEKWPTSGTTR